MKEKLKIRQLIIVEGKYDKIRLSNIVEAIIITTEGFGIYNDKQKRDLLKKLACENGVIIITDSDKAGYQLRVYLSNILKGCEVEHIFTPAIKGKERRKNNPSKEGLLGIEGMEDEILINLLSRFKGKTASDGEEITTVDLYEKGVIGQKNSSITKRKLLKHLNLPPHISNKMLIDILNKNMGRQKFLLIDFENL